MEKIGTCKDCKHWVGYKPNENYCECELEEDLMFIDWGGECDYITFHKDFGCIHFERKELTTINK